MTGFESFFKKNDKKVLKQEQGSTTKTEEDISAKKLLKENVFSSKIKTNKGFVKKEF